MSDTTDQESDNQRRSVRTNNRNEAADLSLELMGMATRHLDDAIFKLESPDTWPEESLAEIGRIPGVKSVIKADHDQRLVVTFDRRSTNFSQVKTSFDQHRLNVTLLNRVNHRQHQNTMKKEEKELEAS